jgi:hypothetical protein
MACCAVLALVQYEDTAALLGVVDDCLVRGLNYTMNWVGRLKAYARGV